MSPPLRFDPIDEAGRQWRARWPEAPVAAMMAVTSVMRAQQILLGRLNEALGGFGLTFARYEVLMLLTFSKKGALPLGKIGERLQVNAASVTNAVDRLEAQGAVTRRSNPDDGRGTLAVLTTSGRSLAGEATGRMNAEVFSDVGMAPGELRALFEAMHTMRRAAGDFD